MNNTIAIISKPLPFFFRLGGGADAGNAEGGGGGGRSSNSTSSELSVISGYNSSKSSRPGASGILPIIVSQISSNAGISRGGLQGPISSVTESRHGPSSYSYSSVSHLFIRKTLW